MQTEPFTESPAGTSPSHSQPIDHPLRCPHLTASQGFWELDLSSWDIAAGSLLVTEAGGRITDARGEPYTLLTRDVFASNGTAEVHDGALAVLRDAAAVRPDPKA